MCLFTWGDFTDLEKTAYKFRRRHLKIDPYQEEAVRNLTNLLFPYQDKDPEHRALQVVKEPYDPSNPVPCVICRGLSVCTALNGYLVQEKYYPKNLNFRETCKVIDTFGSRIEKSIFGGSRTFRDTAQCRGNQSTIQPTHLPLHDHK
ncbi:hypothetical protein EON65_49430 [archaeon]|nr:MAG: hypothetical protein EON65_49430 [archaeon]